MFKKLYTCFTNNSERSFVTNFVVQSLVKNKNFLSQDEQYIKHSIIELFNKFEQYHDELSQDESRRIGG
jgi:spore cortex formation protein SpoVR/YcgB (stage V sporulation)